MKKMVFILLFITLTLNATEVVWDGSVGLDKKEYSKAVKKYVDGKYPEKVKAFKKFNQKYLRKGNIVIDKITKLQWQDDKKAKTITKNWYEAKAYCRNKTLDGYSDWRLPTINELKRIAQRIDIPLLNTTSNYYWSSTTAANTTDYAWYVDFDYGGRHGSNKTNDYYVRCVRAGQ